MAGAPHQLQHRWDAGGVGGVDDGVDDGAGDGSDACACDGSVIGVGDEGSDGIGGSPSIQCEQPGCGVAWPPPHCRLAGERAGDAGLFTPTTHVRGLIRTARW